MSDAVPDIVLSYVVNDLGIVKESYAQIEDALRSGYRVVDISVATVGTGAGNGFAVVTVLLTEGQLESRFVSKGDRVRNG